MSNPVEAALETKAPAALNPVTNRRLKRCTIQCPARVTGIADLPGLDINPVVPVARLRMRIQRPDGEVETCVRAYLPEEIRRVIGPGTWLVALAHEEDRRIAAIDWRATAESIGMRLSWITAGDPYAWPDPDDWPTEGAFEVRDIGWRESKLEKRRREWTPVTARLAGADSGGETDGRIVWKLALDLPDGRRVEVEDRAPSLGVARLIGAKTTQGRFVNSVRRIVRAGAPIAVLLGPKGDAVIDWQATLGFDELRAPPPLTG